MSIDTNIAIYLADGSVEIGTRIDDFDDAPLLTLVELEGGVYADPASSGLRRRRLDAMLAGETILPFEGNVAAVYATIVEALGFSRRRVLDRLLAATAIVHDLTLITTNAADFRDIPGLKLEVWPVPAQ